MNCSPTISIGVSLLAFTAGVWFLHKTQKENPGILFKIAAWFVTIAALLNMACCGMQCMMHSCAMGGGCHNERMHGDCGSMGMMHGGGHMMCGQGCAMEAHDMMGGRMMMEKHMTGHGMMGDGMMEDKECCGHCQSMTKENCCEMGDHDGGHKKGNDSLAGRKK